MNSERRAKIPLKLRKVKNDETLAQAHSDRREAMFSLNLIFPHPHINFWVSAIIWRNICSVLPRSITKKMVPGLYGHSIIELGSGFVLLLKQWNLYFDALIPSTNIFFTAFYIMMLLYIPYRHLRIRILEWWVFLTSPFSSDQHSNIWNCPVFLIFLVLLEGKLVSLLSQNRL